MLLALTPLAAPATTTSPHVRARALELQAEAHHKASARTDRLFAHLLLFEWLAAIIFAAIRTPQTWSGRVAMIHPHVWFAILLGGAILALPLFAAAFRPGHSLTRHIIAAAQMVMSALLIHVTGGRIETHFHIFGSLAFIAFYRDWRVLITATVVVVLDHLLRGLLVPVSVYGTATASLSRTLEHGAWVIFTDIFLIASCVRMTRDTADASLDRAQIEAHAATVERQVLDRTTELRDTQEKLIHAARSAGMAEIATSVLHNVGNVLNSLNVSANVVGDRIRNSELATLSQVNSLIQDNRETLSTFLTTDARGRMVPGFLDELTQVLQKDREATLEEMSSLSNSIEHIKQIVVAQQSMARRSTVQSQLDPRKLAESAIAMIPQQHRGRIQIERDYASGEWIIGLDEHKVLQILVNLLTNAAQALEKLPRPRIVVRVQREDELVRFSVADNGSGIAAENLNRVFSHGFTTKKDGHGFGLHGAANAAREMHGSLTAHSAGTGQGATFTLALPATSALEQSNV